MMQQQRDHHSHSKKQQSSVKHGAAATAANPSSTTAAPRSLLRISPWEATVAVSLALFLGFVVYSFWTDSSLFQNGVNSRVQTYSSTSSSSSSFAQTRVLTKLPSLPVPLYSVTCPNATTPAPSCRPPPPAPSSLFLNTNPPPVCPGYFRYIHEDLKPWSEHGITRQLVESAKQTANFRLTVVDGRLYVTKYSTSFQTRDVFTWWGVVQLLRRYPGRLPDVDLMFNAEDKPVVRAADYPEHKRAKAPPLFSYCTDNETLDIPFPDWSFWGWPEINIKPWGPLSKELEAANRRLPWSKRKPYAFWRGNPKTSWTRYKLMKCDISRGKDWNARLFTQDWIGENKGGYKHSNIADQCNYRYKIYLDGIGWSVSQKYIMACDSMTLRVDSLYVDFFTRGLEPLRHYWPIKDDTTKYCHAIKFAVDWGNRHKGDAMAIGKEASHFMLRQLRMEDVYDYMFHVLSEYAKLLRYKPEVPLGAVELCAEKMMCGRKAMEREFMEMTIVNMSSPRGPCTLPAPLNPREVDAVRSRIDKARKQVNMWERRGS